MSKEISLLSKVLGEDEQALATKLADENGYKEIETKIGGLKVFKSNDEYTGVLNNYRNSLKDVFYNEHKGSIHESLENNIMSKYGVTLKRGEDFKKTDELIDKIIEEKSKAVKAAGSGDDKELQKAQAKIQELNEALLQQETKFKNDYEGKLKDLQITSVLSGIKPMLDVPNENLNENLEFIKYKFEKDGFSIREKDGKHIVYKGEEIYRDQTTYKEIPLESVLLEIASKVSKVKTSPAAGRGATTTTATATNTIDFSAYSTWEEAVRAETNLQNLTIGSAKANQYYEQFLKSKGQA